MKKVKLSQIILEELKKKDVVDIIKNDKDIEKRIKNIVSDVIVDMWRVLWQHNSIFKTLSK